jgi:hypothetical protein
MSRGQPRRPCAVASSSYGRSRKRSSSAPPTGAAAARIRARSGRSRGSGAARRSHARSCPTPPAPARPPDRRPRRALHLPNKWPGHSRGAGATARSCSVQAAGSRRSRAQPHPRHKPARSPATRNSRSHRRRATTPPSSEDRGRPAVSMLPLGGIERRQVHLLNRPWNEPRDHPATTRAALATTTNPAHEHARKLAMPVSIGAE